MIKKTQTKVPTKEEKQIIKDFVDIVRYKRGFSKWWQNYIDNKVLELLGSIPEKKIKKWVQ